jgi:hypothetical protein
MRLIENNQNDVSVFIELDFARDSKGISDHAQHSKRSDEGGVLR